MSRVEPELHPVADDVADLPLRREAFQIGQILETEDYAIVLQNRNQCVQLAAERIEHLVSPAHAASHVPPPDPAPTHHASGMQHYDIGTDGGRKLHIAPHLEIRHLPRLIVEGRQLVQLRVALRGGKRNGTKRMYAADGNPVEHAPEARHLLGRSVITQFQLGKAERERQLSDGLAVVQAPVAPVRGEGEFHGRAIRSSINDSTASSPIAFSDWR